MLIKGQINSLEVCQSGGGAGVELLKVSGFLASFAA